MAPIDAALILAPARAMLSAQHGAGSIASLPTLNDKVRMALDCFKAYSARPGNALVQGVFVAYATVNKLPIGDLADGLEEGARRGLFDQAQNGGVILTDAGFAAV